MEHKNHMANFDLGLYDQLINGVLQKRLDRFATEQLTTKIGEVDPAELPDRVGKFIGQQAYETLTSVKPDQRAKTALRISEAILGILDEFQPNLRKKDQQLIAPIRRLTAIE